MKETLEAMNIHHITTSYYNPQANGAIERSHRTLIDILSKKIRDDPTTWDLYINHSLAAIRFHISDTRQMSPYFCVFSRDPTMALDSVMTPRKRYMGEEFHKVALEQQHKSFVQVHRHLRQAKKQQKEYGDKNSKEQELTVGSPVYLRNHRRTKLDNKWTPYYRVVKQTGPVSFVVRNQLTGEQTKAHARHLRLAKLDHWEIPANKVNRPLRKSTLVMPPNESEYSSSENEEGDGIQQAINMRLVERSDSSDEEDIPLAELRRRLQARKVIQENQPEIIGDNETDNEIDNENSDMSDSDSNNISSQSPLSTPPKSIEDEMMDISIIQKAYKQSKRNENKLKQTIKVLASLS